MIIGKSDIKEFFRKQGKKYFSVFYRGKVETGNPIFKGDEDENIDPSKAMLDFEEWLHFMKAGEYTLIVNNDPKVSNRGSNRVDFRITLDESMGAGLSGSQGSNIGSVGSSTMDVDAIMAKAKTLGADEFQRLMDQRDLADHKQRLADALKDKENAEKALNDPINKFIAALSPHAEPIISGLLGKTGLLNPGTLPAVSGTGEPTETTQQQKILEDFVTALHGARPNDSFLVLEKLTKSIQTDPDKINTALNFL